MMQESAARVGSGEEDEAARAARIDQEFEQALKTLAGEIAELRRRFHGVVDQMGVVGRAGATSMRAATQAAPIDGVGVGEKIAAEIGPEWTALRREVLTTARQHPVRTLGLAAAAGLALGIILRR